LALSANAGTKFRIFRAPHKREQDDNGNGNRSPADLVLSMYEKGENDDNCNLGAVLWSFWLLKKRVTRPSLGLIDLCSVLLLTNKKRDPTTPAAEIYPVIEGTLRLLFAIFKRNDEVREEEKKTARAEAVSRRRIAGQDVIATNKNAAADKEAKKEDMRNSVEYKKIRVGVVHLIVGTLAKLEGGERERAKRLCGKFLSGILDDQFLNNFLGGQVKAAFGINDAKTWVEGLLSAN